MTGRKDQMLSMQIIMLQRWVGVGGGRVLRDLTTQPFQFQMLIFLLRRVVSISPGSDFPRSPGPYAPKFCCGPIDFSG